MKKVYNDIMDFHGIIKDSMKQFFETVYFFFTVNANKTPLFLKCATVGFFGL